MAYLKFLEPSLQFINQIWRRMSLEPSDEVKTGPCEICKIPTEKKCSTCKLVYYCSQEHQKEHWKDHKEACRPYKVCESQDLGKHLVAVRDLQPGDVIFTETPLVFGPKPHKIEEGPFPCVGCCKLIDTSQYSRCPECVWPCCGPDCEGLKAPKLHGFECRVLRLRPPMESASFYEYFRFDVLIILRALYLQKSSKEKWNHLMSLESHMDKRGEDTDVYRLIQEKVAHLEQNYLKPLKAYEHEIGEEILPEVSSEVIHKIYAILDVNATETTEDFDAEILYPTASLVEHNCVPNTSQCIDEKNNFLVTFRAALPIEKDAHITSIYTHILWGTYARRQHLKKTKYFDCRCDRCKDPTELGSLVSALKCIGTEEVPCGGTQLPLNPLDDETNWVCDTCNIELPNKDIMKFVEHLSGEVEKVMVKNPSLSELEDVLNKLMNFLGNNHYLVYIIKHTMVQLYDKVDSDGLEVSNSILEEKLRMCENLIDISKRLDPGNSRLNLYLAVLLNEYFNAKLKIFERAFDSEKKDEYNTSLKELLAILEGNRRVLQNELKSVAGSKLNQLVCENELKLLNWIHENKIDV
ncbi:unnamed protein product [Brassicogethes aeneus]|uniref:Protein msta n=1 Tax=Brassicogethes aeneus TaxID=1431903 RepID=A0A9P0FPM0_BRAAE|nr:unnamed protein product [Brassicogethes aeneus]